MPIDSDNPVVALCAAGMAIEGDASAALRLFEQAWEARCDDYDASIAAHFLTRHQATVDATEARAAIGRAAEVLEDLPMGGYRGFVKRGIDRLGPDWTSSMSRRRRSKALDRNQGRVFVQFVVSDRLALGGSTLVHVPRPIRQERICLSLCSAPGVAPTK